MKLMQFLQKNGLVRVLERHSGGDDYPNEWNESCLINGKEVAEDIFRKEEKRVCLWEDGNYDGLIDPPKIKFSEQITQYILLPWYKK